jgi:16S rRNA (uracil1498-N3)-methyltransferase
MSYFLSNNNLVLDEQRELTGEEAAHILLARRIKTGEQIVLQDTKQQRYLCEVIAIKKHSLVVKPVKQIIPPPEPKIPLTLYQALINEQALDTILQKSTELGLSSINIFPSQHSPIHLKEKAEKKLDRWQKILMEAAKQSDRLQPPKLHYFSGFAQVLEALNQHDLVIISHPFADQSINDAVRQRREPNNPAFCIGPEGGFTDDEYAALQALPNTQLAQLGPRILRAETAAIVTAALLQAAFGDMK